MAKPRVVFVLGAPGSGKGTQCEKIVQHFGYTHLSAGDLLRQERNDPASEVGQLIHNYIKEGKIVPVEITCGLIEKAMVKSGKSKFLIDGFPRNHDNLSGWNEQMGEKAEVAFVLFVECPEEVCTERILKRGQSSGRTDDNIESLRKRFNTYTKETVPIVRHYDQLEKVRKINGGTGRTPDEVFEDVKQMFQ
ncbi:unnamed protein product [Clavelina lepadiformis]|uniref:UMP-CMP kinase n=1 Tax=Clavelina lepadiformis TaxID=159417 RepID=A0ABP0F871_CLALP